MCNCNGSCHTISIPKDWFVGVDVGEVPEISYVTLVTRDLENKDTVHVRVVSNVEDVCEYLTSKISENNNGR